ncbi:Cupredoxin_1 domain-containing protein [Rubrivivax sp. A210]|uniref:cupredoxin domain-containing protein n=1 Tax=Rubrivivax sp. A210 TaxID=2772301 RepID=UPI00191AF45E|nr:cupredoxin domain-containing protein [Rubrivivax sp. A210]CAD5374433.1 Cupredoxin_1 domain-containing protein [Rubrivivax sp. A210]
MPRLPALPALCATAALLAACQTPPAAAPGHVTDGAAIVAAADWDAMETVTVELAEHSFTPSVLRLRAGKPYRIQLRNVGEKDHYYTAPEFFRAVAWRKLMVARQAEIKVDYVNAAEVLARRGQLDLFLVPVRKGSYLVVCTIDDHREHGMEGTIVVE